MPTDVFMAVTDHSLHQGDVLLGLAVPCFSPGYVTPEAGATLDIDFVTLNAIVISQTCDLVNQKVSSLLISPIEDWETLEAQGKIEGSGKEKGKKRKAIARGYESNLTLLAPNRPHFGWSIADFRTIHIVSSEHVKGYLKSGLTVGHYRMSSPFREQFSQSVARFFMRVAMPDSYVRETKEFEEGRWP
jgi:hypothetical protein